MNINHPADWGKLTGMVNGLTRCDAPGGPLKGSDVEIAV